VFNLYDFRHVRPDCLTTLYQVSCAVQETSSTSCVGSGRKIFPRGTGRSLTGVGVQYTDTTSWSIHSCVSNYPYHPGCGAQEVTYLSCT